MADIVLVSLERIVRMGLMIKRAVDTVHRNGDDCRDLADSVVRVSAILAKMARTAAEGGPELEGALVSLEGAMDRAFKLVSRCQKKHVVRHLFTAGDMARDLRRAKDDVGHKVQLVLLAMNVHSNNILRNLAPRPPQISQLSNDFALTDDDDDDDDDDDADSNPESESELRRLVSSLVEEDEEEEEEEEEKGDNDDQEPDSDTEYVLQLRRLVSSLVDDEEEGEGDDDQEEYNDDDDDEDGGELIYLWYIFRQVKPAIY